MLLEKTPQEDPLNIDLPARNSKETRIQFNPLDLLSIFERHTQVAVAKRDYCPVINAYLVSAGLQINPGFRLILDAHHSILAQLQTQTRLPNGLGKSELLKDIAQLVMIYHDLIDCPQIGVRLEILNKASCPKFHIDNTGIRMLCTYFGQGTEWIESTRIAGTILKPTPLSHEDFNRQLISTYGHVKSMPTFAIGLLKGSAWQENHGQGAIHRSPEIPSGQYRVLLTIDALW